MPLTEEEKRNYAYYQLVSDDNDLIGMIGYSLYKKAKIDYIENYFSKYVIYPNDAQLKDFQLQQCGKTNISSHRKYAENLMNSFIHKYMDEHNEDLLRQQKEKIDRKLKNLNERDNKLREKEKAFKKDKTEFERKKWGSFVCGVLQSLIASVIIAVVSIIIILENQLPNNFAEMIASKLSGQ